MAGRLASAGILAAGAACGPDDGNRSLAPSGASGGARIVSLSPALTHTLEELGAGGSIVGQTPWCGIAGVPAVGSLEDRNLEAIASLRPTLVVRQSTVPDPGLDRVAAEAGARVVSVRLDSVADVRASIRTLAEALPRSPSGTDDPTARAELLERAVRTAPDARPVHADPVLFLFSTDPPAAFGRGTYVDDLWTSMGGRNAVAAQGYPALTPEDVIRMAPRAVVSIGGPDAPPTWSTAIDAPWVAVEAPDLLEPSARMLLHGPARLREVDDRIAAARAASPTETRP